MVSLRPPPKRESFTHTPPSFHSSPSSNQNPNPDTDSKPRDKPNSKQVLTPKELSRYLRERWGIRGFE
eukprot:26252-Amorphochlora_amoeboformis.AAC.1